MPVLWMPSLMWWTNVAQSSMQSTSPQVCMNIPCVVLIPAQHTALAALYNVHVLGKSCSQSTTGVCLLSQFAAYVLAAPAPLCRVPAGQGDPWEDDMHGPAHSACMQWYIYRSSMSAKSDLRACCGINFRQLHCQARQTELHVLH